jgi:DNA polymerase I-like protein with 3'-5' exonuclease and polymerase domains
MKIIYATTNQQFEEALKELQKIPKLCLDAETTGLDSHVSKLRLLQLCTTDEKVEDRVIYVLDLFKISDTSGLKELIESREMLLGHNLNFDLQFLFSINIDYKGKIFDTYIAERCLRAGFKEKKVSPKLQKPYFDDVSCSLKAVVSRRLELDISKEQQVSDWSKEELDIEQIEYAAKDVDLLPKIAADQLKELAEEALLDLYSLESKCIHSVASMCYRGFNVDIGKLVALKNAIQIKLDDITLDFCTKLDSALPSELKLPRKTDGSLAIGKNLRKEFNPGSGVQCTKCFEALGVALPVSPGTGKSTLNQIQLAEFDSDDPLLNLYRKRTKVETQLEHAEKLIANINPITNRIHSGYNQYGANSGRFTSSGAKKTSTKKVKNQFAINAQQIPRDKEFRECFVATPGYKLIICDFSQIELRLGAELIGIPQMIEAFKQGHDLHTVTASLIYKIPLEEVQKNQRQEGKTLNFALLYGMGFRKYKTYAAQSGKIISLSEAKVAHASFHNAYPRLRQWHRERSAMVEDGWTYVRTPLGRRRLLSYNDATMTACANTLIQGAGADVLKLSLAKLSSHLGNEAHLVACVHDEIVLEAIEDKVDYYKDILESCMKEAAETILKEVPSKADASFGDTWFEK